MDTSSFCSKHASFSLAEAQTVPQNHSRLVQCGRSSSLYYTFILFWAFHSNVFHFLKFYCIDFYHRNTGASSLQLVFFSQVKVKRNQNLSDGAGDLSVSDCDAVSCVHIMSAG